MRTFFHWLFDKLAPKPAYERCESAWEPDPYLAEQVRAALHPVNIEEMPTPKPLTSNERN